MKQSRIKRLVPKKLLERIARARGRRRAELEALAEREASEVIAKLHQKGYELLTRLETGEGVFVRENDLVGLHIQLPSALYERLESECRRRETTKRHVVTVALEDYLERQG